jgi:hypothetical protein
LIAARQKAILEPPEDSARKHIYLEVVLDLASRNCIGWDLGRSLGGQLAMNALVKEYLV